MSNRSPNILWTIDYSSMTPITHGWFASYLPGRKQHVVINDRKFDDFHLNCGVP